MLGKIKKADCYINVHKRLVVNCEITTSEGPVIARMPERELAAILPKDVLLGGFNSTTTDLLETIIPLVSRFTKGRSVRVITEGGQLYFEYLSWEKVIFN